MKTWRIIGSGYSFRGRFKTARKDCAPDLQHLRAGSASRFFSNHFRDGTGGQPLIVQCTDCDFLGGAGGYNLLMGFTNCLFNRSGMGNSTGNSYPYEIYRNCTFYGGSLGFGHWEGGAPYWYSCIRDCAFDGTTFAIDDPFGVNTSYADYNYNAFLTGAAQPPTEGANTIPVGTTFNWQAGPLGNFYLPTDSPLIDAGSDTAYHLFGLSGATTQISESPDLGPVDIGYHYPFTLLKGDDSYLSDSLLVYYRLNDPPGSPTLADSSGHGYNANLIGAPGLNGEYMTLDGSSQYADAGNVAITTGMTGGDCTFVAWINEAQPTDGTFYGILDKSVLVVGYPGQNTGWGFWLNTDNNPMFAGGGNNAIDNAPAVIPTGQWTQIALVWDSQSQQASFYYNGVFRDTLLNESPQSSASSAHLLLGNLDDNALTGCMFNGYLKQVAAYTRTLTGDEIAENFFETETCSNIAYPSLPYYKISNADYLRYGNEPKDENGLALMTFPDYSLHGGTTGSFTMDDDNWVSNPGGTAKSTIHFHGSGTYYLETGNPADFDFTTGPFSVNFWIDPLNDGQQIFENNRGGLTGWIIKMNGSDNIMLSNGSQAVISDSGSVLQGQTIDKQVVPDWTMVTVVVDGNGNAYIYINGQLEKSGAFGPITPNNNSLRIASPDDGGGQFDGDLWGIQIWGQALTAGDVINLYLHQKNGINYWP